MFSEKMGLPFCRRRRTVPSITLIYWKMAFFNNLLWEKYPVDFHKTFRVCLSCKGLLLCKFPKPTELFNTFKIEHESRDFRKSLNFYIADAGKKKRKKNELRLCAGKFRY